MPRARQKANRFSRRVFIQRLAFFGGGEVLIGPACKRGAALDAESKSSPDAALTPWPHRTLASRECRLVAAACGRILPRGEAPGPVASTVPGSFGRVLGPG